ncbi:MAG: hypothetical protein JWP87_1236 [Labilithrix sp.]|nr:hypothetical protein [Labilithrix sp.]
MNRTPLAALLLLFVVAAPACAAPSGEDSEPFDTAATESAVTGAHWQSIYRCDDGSVLDVNTNERRELQFVVRNAAAKKHLMTAYSTATFDWNLSPSGEVIFRGTVQYGIFNPGDFTRAVAISGRPKVQVGDQWGPTVEITRTGSDITLLASEYVNWTFRNCR